MYHFSTAGSTNLQKIPSNEGALKGVVAACNAAYAVYLKVYWFTPNSAASPTVGTTAPNLTFTINAAGAATPGLAANFTSPIQGQGQLWVAVTKVSTDADATAVLANDATITVIYD